MSSQTTLFGMRESRLFGLLTLGVIVGLGFLVAGEALHVNPFLFVGGIVILASVFTMAAAINRMDH